MADEGGGWLQRKAPKVHRFLTRDDKPYPLLREVGAIVLLVLVLVAALWGGTGQPIGDRPVVVVESGSMMHCTNGVGVAPSALCEGKRYGRFGTIDPGDLIFVRDIDGADDVVTQADGGRDRYGRPGDVLVYRPGGDGTRTPIIHRALFFLEITPTESGPRYTVESLGIRGASAQQLAADPSVQALVGTESFNYIDQNCSGPGASGFITRGDNNQYIDQSGASNLGCPVRPEWVLGKSRGEVPWIGLVNLKFNDLLSKPPHQTNNYDNAPSDVRAMMWATILLVVGGPILLDLVARQRAKRRPDEGAGDPPAEGPGTP